MQYVIKGGISSQEEKDELFEKCHQEQLANWKKIRKKIVTSLSHTKFNSNCVNNVKVKVIDNIKVPEENIDI